MSLLSRSRPFSVAVGAAVLAMSTSACVASLGDDGPVELPSPVPGTSVSVVDNAFRPDALQVQAGDTVTWTWEGDSPHDVKAETFSSPIQQDGTFTHTFTDPGEYHYVCSVHSGMRGRVVVAGS